MLTTLIVLGICAVLAMYLLNIYNRFVTLRNRLDNALAQIEVQLIRRLDLIPNLIEVAKGYMKHERQTLTEITQAREGVLNALKRFSDSPNSPQNAALLSQAESQLGALLSGFKLSVEAYPDLKASANMAQLTEELTTTENQVSFARQAYNDAATKYNTYKKSAPPVLFSNLFGHGTDATLLDFSDRPERNTAPKVDFS